MTRNTSKEIGENDELIEDLREEVLSYLDSLDDQLVQYKQTKLKLRRVNTVKKNLRREILEGKQVTSNTRYHKSKCRVK